MKFLSFSWSGVPASSKHHEGQTKASQDTLPTLPTELWRKIIGFTVRLAGRNSIDREDPFSTPYITEEYPEVDPGLLQDRQGVSLVCSGWHAVVREISAEYLVIYSGKQLKSLLKNYEFKKNGTGKPLGEWTQRIDFKILGHYSVQHVVRLLRCTPNLMIYVNKNGSPSVPERCMPIEVIKCLVSYTSKSLQRIEWNGAGEPPRYQDLVELCNGLPNLTTLRLASIFSFPCLRDGVPPALILPKLKTLSLAVIPEPNERRQEYAVTWDPFLQYMSIHPKQLPCLERFECDIFPIHTMGFFHMHGHKIHLFRTTAWSADTVLPEALSLCPTLHSLVIAQGSETVALPDFHPTLTKICIIPTVDLVVDVPRRVFDHAVMAPLDSLLKSLERMAAPHLIELRIRNVGSYFNIIEHSTWLRFWWIRWNIRGVQFRDKCGQSYQYVHDPGEALLDSIRG